MIFKVGHLKVEISENVINIFTHFKQFKRKAHESGGIVFGQVKENYIYISKATTPSRHDSSSRFNFIRDYNVAQIIVDYEFYNKNGHLIYLGEWHTHPEDTPKPSTQDIMMIKEQYTSNKLNEKYLLLIIIGINSTYLGMFNGKTLIDGEQTDKVL